MIGKNLSSFGSNLVSMCGSHAFHNRNVTAASCAPHAKPTIAPNASGSTPSASRSLPPVADQKKKPIVSGAFLLSAGSSNVSYTPTKSIDSPRSSSRQQSIRSFDDDSGEAALNAVSAAISNLSAAHEQMTPSDQLRPAYAITFTLVSGPVRRFKRICDAIQSNVISNRRPTTTGSAAITTANSTTTTNDHRSGGKPKPNDSGVNHNAEQTPPTNHKHEPEIKISTGSGASIVISGHNSSEAPSASYGAHVSRSSTSSTASYSVQSGLSTPFSAIHSLLGSPVKSSRKASRESADPLAVDGVSSNCTSNSVCPVPSAPNMMLASSEKDARTGPTPVAHKTLSVDRCKGPIPAFGGSAPNSSSGGAGGGGFLCKVGSIVLSRCKSSDQPPPPACSLTFAEPALSEFQKEAKLINANNNEPASSKGNSLRLFVSNGRKLNVD